MVFDQASAAMARGDVMIHARDGKTLPPGIGIDENGAETNDPNAVARPDCPSEDTRGPQLR